MSEQQPPPAHPPAAALTGVDAALGRLDGVAQLPVEEHVAVFDEVHRLLQDALATLDSA